MRCQVSRACRVGSWPSALGCWPSALGRWPSAIGCWPSAIGCWLSAIGCWLSAIGCWLSAVGAPPAVAAETSAPSPRCAALCIGVAAPAEEGADRGAADAALLAEALRRAGAAPVTVLTNAAAGRDALVAALFRLRAGLRAGDLAIVAFSGPVSVSSDDTRDVFHLLPAGGSDGDALSVPDLVVPLLARADADLAVLVTGLPGLGRRTTTAGPWRQPAGNAGPLRSCLLLASGGRGEPTEAARARTLLGANLASELERAAGRDAGGVKVQDWLRAVVRRVTLESGTRQTPDLAAIGDAAEARIAPAAGPAAPDSGKTEDAFDIALLRAAAGIETPTADSPAELDKDLVLLGRIAGGAGHAALSMAFASERLRRATAPADRARLLHELGRAALQAGRTPEAIALHRQALEARPEDAAGRAWLADALASAGEPEAAREAATDALRRAPPPASPPTVDDDAMRAVLQEVLGHCYMTRDEADKALACFETALEHRRRLGDSDPARLARLLRSTAEARIRSGRPASAVPLLKESTGLFVDSGAPQMDLARTAMVLGDALDAAGEPGALEARQEALAKWTATTDAPPPATLLAAIGEDLAAAGRIEEARPALSGALDRAADNPALRIRIHRILSGIAKKAKDSVGALHHAQLALATAAGPPPAPPAEVAGLCGDLAALHLERGEVQRAIEYGDRAVDERRKAGLTNDASAAATWILLGRAHEAEKSHAAAAAAWSNAVHVLKKTEGANAIAVALALTREGRAWLEAGDATQAARSLDEARLVYRIRTSAEPAARADALLGLGEAQERLGDRTKARDSLEAALEIATAGGEACDVFRGRILLGLARIGRADSRLFEARRLLSDALPLLDRLEARDRTEALSLDRMLQSALVPHGPQGSQAEIQAFRAADADRAARGADASPR